ncbi:MAG: TrkH family potassium uptake protein, partial [Clostridia bacterium]|nr:TrkH family potassium uptake protein [Clostridia bacterium]
FDAVTISYGTVGTGGFAITNIGIASYDSYYLQGVITVFMILCGVNFNIYYLLFMREFKLAFKNLELRVYLCVILTSTLLITWNTFGMYESLRSAFHHSIFQVVSIITTTGFATVDFNLWPEFSKMILFILMFIGASAGSTGGGIKVSRCIIMYKSIKNEIKKLIHPRSVKLIRMDGKILSDDTMHSVSIYFGTYFAIFALSILVVSLDGFSFMTTVSSVAACLNNIGPGFDVVGPLGNFGSLSVLSKLVLSADMLIGRLEIFPMLLLFSPSLWIRSK